MANFVTKDMDLSQRLQKDGFHIVGVAKKENMKIHTFAESDKEIGKHLGWELPEEPEPEIVPVKPKIEFKKKGVK